MPSMRIAVAVLAGVTLVGIRSEASEQAPSLTPAQTERLTKIQAMFLPGGTTDLSGRGIEKSAEFCGAAIPLEVDASTVALEEPVEPLDRTRIVGSCHAAAGALVRECNREQSFHPRDVIGPNLKKEIVANVKKLVCKATKEPSEVDDRNKHKWSFDNGSLVFTYLANKDFHDVEEDGMAFIQKQFKVTMDAKAEFMRDMHNQLARYKESCGADLTLEVDFENATKVKTAVKGAGEKKTSSGKEFAKDDRCESGDYARTWGAACSEVVNYLADSCEEAKKQRQATSPSASPTSLSKVTTLECLTTGAKKFDPEEACSVYTERNMSFKDGTLTFNMAPSLQSEIRRATDNTLDPPVSQSEGRRSGMACGKPAECASRICESGKCKPCGAKRLCPSGFICRVDGACREPNRFGGEPMSPPSGASSGEKKDLKGLGGTCQYNSECASKHCGTLSSGQHHKCVSR
jgi:hypothetical protein